MVKKELLALVAEQTGGTIKDATAFYDAFVATIETALKNGDKVQLSGFGNFELKVKKARDGLNPATGAKIQIPASKAPSFKAAKQFKEAFN